MTSIDFAASSCLNIHFRISWNHDSAAHIPINFAACSPPIIFSVRTTNAENVICARICPLQIPSLSMNCYKNVTLEKNFCFQHKELKVKESLKLPTLNTTLVPI